MVDVTSDIQYQAAGQPFNIFKTKPPMKRSGILKYYNHRDGVCGRDLLSGQSPSLLCWGLGGGRGDGILVPVSLSFPGHLNP